MVMSSRLRAHTFTTRIRTRVRMPTRLVMHIRLTLLTATSTATGGGITEAGITEIVMIVGAVAFGGEPLAQPLLGNKSPAVILAAGLFLRGRLVSPKFPNSFRVQATRVSTSTTTTLQKWRG